MLFLLSPAKSLDYERKLPRAWLNRATEPLFTGQAAQLIDLLKPLPASAVAQLMDLSDDLAQLNVARYAAWAPQATPHNSRPAVLAFNGDVYDGLDATTLKTTDLSWAQQHLVILSGLYGALRPLDSLQPYRLEMGTRLAHAQGPDLYSFWGDTVAQYLQQRLADDSSPVIVNLASQEYFRVADRPLLRSARIVTCVFEDWKVDQYKVISFFAKRARGLMARWAIQNRVASARKLTQFEADGYTWDKAASQADRLVFRRRVAD